MTWNPSNRIQSESPLRFGPRSLATPVPPCLLRLSCCLLLSLNLSLLSLCCLLEIKNNKGWGVGLVHSNNCHWNIGDNPSLCEL